MMWSYSLNPLHPIPNILKITYSIQMITGKSFTIIHLANMFFPVPLSTASQLQFIFTSKGQSTSFPGYLQDTSTALPLRTISEDKILFVSTFLQKYRYCIKLMTAPLLQGDLFDILIKDIKIQYGVVLFGFWWQRIPHLQILLNLSNAVTYKSVYLK